jgi:hypothetical protein
VTRELVYQIRENGMDMWHALQKRNACRVLVGKTEGKRPLERPGHRWKSSIKIYFK